MRWSLALSLCLVASTASAQRRKLDPFATPHPVAVPTAGSSYTGLGAESVTPAEIAQFAPAALPREVSNHIQALLDIRSAGAGAITARGDRMYFTSSVTGAPQVWRQDGPMKLAVQLTGGEDRTSLVAMAPDESWLVVARDIGGAENPGLYILRPGGGPLAVVQHTPKVQTALQFISDDSKTIYYRANDIAPDSFAIYRYDVATQQRTLVFDRPGLWNIEDQRGTQWLLSKQLGNAQNEIYTYDTRTQLLQPLLGQGEVEEFDAKFGARPGQVLVMTNKLGDFERLYSLEAGQLTPITPVMAHDVQSFAIDQKRVRLYYTTNDGGYQRLTALDARTLRPVPLPRLPDAENVMLQGLSRSGRFIELTIDAATLPSTTFTYDWQTRRTTAWRVATTPEIDTTTFAKATLETFPARDGTPIPMFVRRPASCAAPCAVVVSFHGGPEGQSTAGFSAVAQMFVDAGFVYVQPNVRGSSGYGKAWLHADDGPKRLGVITDIEDVARYIKTAWAKDGVAPKIGVTGGSYGGYATLMAMTYFAGAYDAGVQQVGISDLRSFLRNTAPYRRILRISEYGDPDKDAAALATLSPITHVDKLRAPLLSIQGVNDPRVPVGEAIQIYRALVRRNIPGGLILFADEGHGATKRENRALAFGHTIAFFEKYLR